MLGSVHFWHIGFVRVQGLNRVLFLLGLIGFVGV